MLDRYAPGKKPLQLPPCPHHGLGKAVNSAITTHRKIKQVPIEAPAPGTKITTSVNPMIAPSPRKKKSVTA